jgi:hypothetical protein
VGLPHKFENIGEGFNNSVALPPTALFDAGLELKVVRLALKDIYFSGLR